MSEYIEYIPENFSIEMGIGASRVGLFIIGRSKIGEVDEIWTPLELASFTYTATYSPNNEKVDVFFEDDYIESYTNTGTPIYDSEVANVSVSYWGMPERPPMLIGDRIRMRYKSNYDETNWFEFVGIVVSVTKKMSEVPAAADRAKRFRYTFTASLLGLYAVMLTKTICVTALEDGFKNYEPAIQWEPWTNRMSRWVQVTGDIS